MIGTEKNLAFLADFNTIMDSSVRA